MTALEAAKGLAARQATPISITRAEPRWPDPPAAAAFHGLAGDIVRAIEPHSEADPVALLVQVLAAFGNCIDRGPFYKVEGDEHHANIFVVLVGETSKARKGTSFGRVREFFVNALNEDNWVMDRVQSGLSSGEGLIWAVRDPITKHDTDKKSGEVTETTIDEGVWDKRLLVQESEFAGTLRVMMRDGSTLSRIVRDAWDRGDLASMTKNSPARATGAHVSIIGHCTSEELRRYLDVTETANGFANRFIYLCVKRSKVLAFGGDAVEMRRAMQPSEKRFMQAVETARTDRHEMTWDVDARALWAECYEHLSEGKPGMLGAITGRAEAQVVRLALIYALMDGAAGIGRAHLEAALALWSYAAASAAFVFGESLGDPVADTVLAALQGAGGAGLSRSALRDLFGRHTPSAQIERALALLLRQGLVIGERRQTAGRPVDVWRAVTAQ